MYFFHLRRCNFSAISAVEPDFKSILSKYKDLLKNLVSSANGINALEKLTVKLGTSKKSATLNDIGTLNVIDSQKVELTTHDPQVIWNINWVSNIF